MMDGAIHILALQRKPKSLDLFLIKEGG